MFLPLLPGPGLPMSPASASHMSFTPPASSVGVTLGLGKGGDLPKVIRTQQAKAI